MSAHIGDYIPGIFTVKFCGRVYLLLKAVCLLVSCEVFIGYAEFWAPFQTQRDVNENNVQ